MDFLLVACSTCALVIVPSVFMVKRILVRVYPVHPAEHSAVLITGTSGGIGLAAAQHLAKRGYTVFGTVRKEADGAKASQAIKGEFFPLVCDVAKPEQVEAASASLIAKLKEINQRRERNNHPLQLVGLVNNAGILEYDTELQTRTLCSVLDVNVVGAFRMTETFMPLLRESKGRLVFIGSYFGSFTPSGTTISYAASKHALEAISDGLRRRYLEEDVAVTLVKPGNIKTNMNDKYGESNADAVSCAIEHALSNSAPKPRYYPGSLQGNPCMLVCKVLAVLPERITDKLLGFN